MPPQWTGQPLHPREVTHVKVSVIIPTLNEEQSIGETLDEIPDEIEGIDEIEVMIVDGLSTDRTREIAESKGATVLIEEQKGYGRAYKTGMSTADGDIVVTLDGDTTYPADDIPRLVTMLMESEYDFITCDRLSKLKKGVMNRTHRLGNWILKATTNLLFGMHLKDSQTGMWVFYRKILDKLHVTSDGMPFSEEIKIEAFKHPEVNAVEVPVDYRVRVGDIKLSTWGDGRKNLKFLFKKRFSRKLKKTPRDW